MSGFFCQEEMTDDEIVKLFLAHSDKEIRSFNRGHLFLFRKNIKISRTRILEDWQKDANFALPEKICFPKDSCEFMLDHNGVYINRKLTKWSDIRFTALAKHDVQSGERGPTYIQNYFMAYTNSGKIINCEIGDLTEYYNLYGHFIELYKTTS